MTKTSATEITKMTETLRQHGAWAHGSESPEDVAATWAGEGILTEEEMSGWLDAGVFGADAAAELRRAGIKPTEVSYAVGYAYANSDLSLDEVLARIGR